MVEMMENDGNGDGLVRQAMQCGFAAVSHFALHLFESVFAATFHCRYLSRHESSVPVWIWQMEPCLEPHSDRDS